MAKSPFAGVKSSAMRTQVERSVASLLPLEQITERFDGDTRSLNQTHVEALSESIAVLGLIQPIAIDNKGRLLAGGHRRAAITRLKETNADAYQQHFSKGIPTRAYDFDSEKEPELALAIEAAENEKRRDYTPTEVRGLAERLKNAGFHHTRGRSLAGQKSLAPTLAAVIGKSTRTVERYLAADSNGAADLNPTDDGFRKQLERSIKALRKLQSMRTSTELQEKVAQDLPQLIDLLEKGLM
ncbi:MAG: ParB/RepB/Spo0J family partition protein [Leptolyngbya sp. Prado105]|jgi:ParB family chromosome partitioning protein|nr:ParB/RepB/Spo0J family partition protein [Leptolyngbya sp. Prado105]